MSLIHHAVGTLIPLSPAPFDDVVTTSCRPPSPGASSLSPKLRLPGNRTSLLQAVASARRKKSRVGEDDAGHRVPPGGNATLLFWEIPARVNRAGCSSASPQTTVGSPTPTGSGCGSSGLVFHGQEAEHQRRTICVLRDPDPITTVRLTWIEDGLVGAVPFD